MPAFAYASHLLRIGVCAAVFAFASPSHAGDNGQQPVDWTTRFRQEAPAAWKEARAALGRIQASYSLKVSQNGNARPDKHFEIKQNKNCRMLIYELENKTQLFAYNPHYSFELRKSAANGSWAVKKLHLKPIPQNRHVREVDEEIDTSWLYVLLKAPPVGDLPELMRKSTFRLLSVRPITKEGRTLVEVSFSNKHEGTAESNYPIQGGTLCLDPARSWYLTSSTVDVEYSNGRGKWNSELTLVGAASLAPKRLLIDDDGYVIPDGKGKESKKADRLRFEVDFTCGTSLPDDADFTLSAFGLPDPMGMPAPVRSRSLWYLWLILIGAGLLVAALLLRWRIKGRNTASGASVPPG